MSIAPFDFALNLQAMTIEKLKFSLPAVFTIGPENEQAALRKYALLLSGSSKGSDFHKKADVIDPARRDHVQDIVKGIIEGETRVIVSGMSMEEIFKERQVFKDRGETCPYRRLCVIVLLMPSIVIENVQKELEQFGLRM